MNTINRFFRKIGITTGILAGRPVSVEALYEQYAESLYSYALSLLRSIEAAEEVVQNSFLKLVRSPEILDRARDAKPYLYAMVRNEVYDHIRKGGEELLVDSYDGLMFEESSREDEILLQQLVKELPAEQREVIVLKIYQGLTFKEIADIVSIPQNTAASRYRYAISALRQKMEVTA
jgi:RNA polymerase sigma-70 factor (ECF subfamily)